MSEEAPTKFMTKTPDGVWIRLTSEPASLSPEALADVLDSEKLVIEWFKAARAHVEREMREGRLRVPGYEFGPGRRSFDWRDEASAVTAMRGAGINDPYKRELYSPAQAKKMIPEDRHPLLDAVIETKPGAPVLRRVGTHRQTADIEQIAATPGKYGF
jgi:hypothetical protein